MSYEPDPSNLRCAPVEDRTAHRAPAERAGREAAVFGFNPYAAPTAGAEAGGRRSFAFTDEVRALISTTATLMIAAGLVQLVPELVELITDEFSLVSLVTLSLFGIIPVFTLIAGFSLRALAKPGDDLGALLAGFRQLYVAYLIKGIVLLLIVGLMLLVLALMFFGAGVGFFNMWG